MSMAQARGILPALIARGRDPGCETSAHEALLETAWSLSPRVEDAELDLVFADVDGMHNLYDGEHDLGQAAKVTADALDLPIRVGIAANKLAARIAARQPDSPTVVPPGGEVAFLAALPLRHLRLERRLAETLGRWGVPTLGDLARLPADRVASRLGPAGAAAHQAARGIDPQPLVPYQPPPTLDRGHGTRVAGGHRRSPALRPPPAPRSDPATSRGPRSRLRPARARTRSRTGGQRPPDHPAARPDPRCRRPGRADPARARGQPTRAAVAAFACFVHPDRPRRGQLTLFGAPEIHPEKLAATIAHIAARIGPDRVGSPRDRRRPPPRALRHRHLRPTPGPQARSREPKNGRGLFAVRVLRPPVPLEVITEEVNDDSSHSQDFEL